MTGSRNKVFKMQDTPFIKRLGIWLLNGCLWFAVALYPSCQMANFADDSTVHYTFVAAVGFMVLLFFLFSKLFAKDA